jgi:hypothetical protein
MDGGPSRGNEAVVKGVSREQPILESGQQNLYPELELQVSGY